MHGPSGVPKNPDVPINIVGVVEIPGELPCQ
jgi:hypothetical protein